LSTFPQKRLGDLLADPLRSWIRRDANPTDLSLADAQHNEREQALECPGWSDQEVHSRNAIRVIAQ
jgi:hypothetical protein